MLAEPLNKQGGMVFKDTVKGLKWKLEEADQRLVTTLCQKLNIPVLLATILINRHILGPEEAMFYLEPRIKDLIPDPFALKDMHKASERLATAIINGEKIAVFGDYDVDGATSTALLKRFFKDIGHELTIYIPNRIIEGYGPNINALKKLKDEGNTLIITVDCGIVSHEPLKEIKEMGVDVIILDHHLSTHTLPEAYAIVNPNRFDDDFSFKSIAAVGIAFFTVIAIRAKLREKGWFKGKTELDLLQYLDLVALGTVCDVMQLVGINRAFVNQGLKLIAARKNVGIAVLSDMAKIHTYPQSYHLGFVLGPRINAGGRVGEGMLGTELLSTEDAERAYQIALKLEKLNDERRGIEALMIEEAIEKIESQKLYKNPLILVQGSNWHQGVLGIIASRIKERYNRPAAVISLVNGMGKGSARSISGIDLGSLLANAKALGILEQGGGHAMAGGFTVAENKVDEFYAYANLKLEGCESIFKKAKEFQVDAVISVSGATGELVKLIARSAPFGSGNPQPKFALTNVLIVNIRLVGANHLMVIVADNKSDVKSRATLKCMLFKALDSEIGKVISTSVGRKVTLFGILQQNFNDNNKADFIIEDFCFEE